jgi:hypothetical protein
MLGVLSANNFLLVALAMMSCGNPKQEKETVELIVSEIDTAIATNSKQNELKLNGYEKTFVYEDNLVKQILGVNYKGENIIEFSLKLEKKDGSCKVNFQGEAKNKNENLDPELDEDEEGIAYPSNEFVYEKEKCIIALRIAMKEKDKAIIKTVGCNDTCCPETSNLLKLVR